MPSHGGTTMRTDETAGTLAWEIAIPLLQNPLITGALAKVFALSGLLVAGMLSLIFWVQGDTEELGMLWLAFAGVSAGLYLLSLLVMLLVFGNRMQLRFIVDAEGIRQLMVDRRARGANRLAILVGLLLREPRTLGAGLLARSQEVQTLRWRGAFSAVLQPARHAILLRNRWRTLMIVYTSAEQYPAVAARIQSELAAHGSTARIPARSPLPQTLALSAGVVLACAPLFALVEAFDVSLMLPLLQLCFGLATVWLIGVFGWVLIALDGLILADLLLHALGEQPSGLHPGEQLTRWTLYADSEWGLLALAAIALGALGWLGWRCAHGRPQALLMADWGDAGE